MPMSDDEELGADAGPELLDKRSKVTVEPISIRRRMNALTINFLIVGAYLAFGGAVIMQIELGIEEDSRVVTLDLVDKMIINNGISLGSDHEDAVAFRKDLEDIGCGIRQKDHDYDFDFTGSIFFALTVVTTIGYGNFVPSTMGGQIFVTCYSVIGISLILNFMFQSSSMWLMIVKGVLQRFCKVKVKAQQSIVSDLSFDAIDQSRNGTIDARELRGVLQELSGSDDRIDESIIAYCMMHADRDKTGTLDRDGLLNAVAVYLQIAPTIPSGADLSVMLLAAVIIMIWITVWGVAIGGEEGWTFRESLWFGYVTLTTIGFGDKAPETHMGRIQAFMFIFVGLGMVAWLVSQLFEKWRTTTFWFMQRSYEKGYVSEKFMDIRGYIFKSPLGRPKRLAFCGFESRTPPRVATLDQTYIEAINSENPKPLKKSAPTPLRSGKASPTNTKERLPRGRKGTVTSASESVGIEMTQDDSGAGYQPLKEDGPPSSTTTPLKPPTGRKSTLTKEGGKEKDKDKDKDTPGNSSFSPSASPARVKSAKKGRKGSSPHTPVGKANTSPLTADDI